MLSYHMAGMSLPPGFRFHPTDVELLMFYLKRKVMGKKLHVEAISELNLYKFSPWDLPDKSALKAKDLEWYFFCPRERKYASGARVNRATETGYWKTTGNDRSISYKDRVVGMVKTLVFHEGSAPHGKRTDWVIHEYRLSDKTLADAGVVQDSFVLCKVFHKSGPGPKNGAQYGAPFKEEEWEDDVSVASTLPSDALAPLVYAFPENQNWSVATSMAAAGKHCTPLLGEAAESKFQSSTKNVNCDDRNYSMVANMVGPGSASCWSLTEEGLNSVGSNVNDVSVDEAGDIAHVLRAFFESRGVPPYENCNIQLGNLDYGGDTGPVQFAGSGSLNNLGDLSYLGGRTDATASRFGCNQSNLLLQDDVPFLELHDLDAPLIFSEGSNGPELPSDGLYGGPCTPFGPEQNNFTGMLNLDNYCSQTGQSFCNGHFLGPQTSFPGLNELLVLPNSSDGLVDSLNVSQNVNGYACNFSWIFNTSHNFYSVTAQPGEIRGAAEFQERGRS